MKARELAKGDKITLNGPCHLCDYDSARVVATIGRNMQRLTTVVCNGCGLVQSAPIPTNEELSTFYKENYRTDYKLSYRPKKKHVWRYAPGALRRVRKIQQYINKDQTKILDIGSGSGEFLYMCKEVGLETQGVEPNKGYADYTINDLGLNVFNSTFEETDFTEGTFDIINLNHVLEHLPRPFEILSTINKLLKKGGIFAVDVPNVEETTHAPFTHFHYAHIYNYNHDTLKALLNKAGFEVMNSDENTTDIIAKKVKEPDTSLKIHMPENAEKIFMHLTRHTVTAHYKSVRPYQRFFGKCYRYPKEIMMGLIYNQPRKILDHFYKKAA